MLPQVPIGVPISQTRVYILDSNLKPVPAGTLYIGGIGVAKGYRNMQNNEAFFVPPTCIKDTFPDEGRLVIW